jgi:hypothetical protein
LAGGAEIAEKLNAGGGFSNLRRNNRAALRFTALHAPMEFAEWTRWEREGAPPDFGISGEPARVAGGRRGAAPGPLDRPARRAGEPV